MTASKHIGAVAAAEPAGFASLVERHSRFLFRVAYSLLGNREDAEDAVQETFMKIFRANEEMNGIEDERAYLARAVWRSGLDRLVTAQSKAMRHAEDAGALDLPAAGPSPEQEAVDLSDRKLLRRLIAGLPEDLRQPLVLSAVEEMRPADVAAMLGIPAGTVRTRIHRAKAELKRRFAALPAAHAVEARL